MPMILEVRTARHQVIPLFPHGTFFTMMTTPPKKQLSMTRFLKLSSVPAMPEEKIADACNGSLIHKRKRSPLTSPQHCSITKNCNNDGTKDEDDNNIIAQQRNLKEAEELQRAFLAIAEKKKRNKNKVVTSEVIKLTLDGSSWMVRITNYCTPPSISLTDNSINNNINGNVFEEIWRKHPKTRKSIGKLFGRNTECFENRFSQSYGVPFTYSGHTNDVPRPTEEDPVLMELLSEINSAVRTERGPYNGCLVNWYLPEHTIAPHSDDEKSMKYQSPIFSLSWGGPRRFVVQPKTKYKNSNNCNYCTSADITLHCGDLLIMGGSLQQTHTHEIPKWRKTKDLHVPTRRINWTVRAFCNK